MSGVIAHRPAPSSCHERSQATTPRRMLPMGDFYPRGGGVFSIQRTRPEPPSRQNPPPIRIPPRFG